MVRKLNSETAMAIFLTSHDVDDSDAICDFVILLHKGLVRVDGGLINFLDSLPEDKIVSFETHHTGEELNVWFGEVLSLTDGHANIIFNSKAIDVTHIYNELATKGRIEIISHNPIGIKAMLKEYDVAWREDRQRH